MEIYDQYTFLHRHIIIRRVENTGAFLSMGESFSGPLKFIFLDILPLLVVIFGLYFVFTKTDLDKLILTGLVMVIGGGTANLYDRLVHGSVTDFMHINFGIFQTGIFNIADLSITTGLCIMLIRAWTKKKVETVDADE